MEKRDVPVVVRGEESGGFHTEHAGAPHAGEATLSTLLRAAQAGDRAALNALLGWARPRLLTIALRMVRDADDAQDVVQEAMVKVCRHIGRFEQRSSFATWLHRIGTNAALDWLRRQKSRVDHPIAAGPGADEGDRPQPASVDDRTPELLLGGAEVDRAVRGAMRTLPKLQHDVLALREIDGASYLEIAKVARCPIGTVMSRLHHARRRLTEVLTPQRDELMAA